MLHPSLTTASQDSVARRFQAALALDERYGLSRNALRLQRLARQGQFIKGPFGDHIRERYAAIIEQQTADLRVFPFLTPPPSIGTGDFHFGDAGAIPFRITREEAQCHTLLVGPSGSGKTSLAQRVAIQARVEGVHVIAPDYKGDLQWQAATDDDYVIIHPNVPLNILEHDDKIDRDSFIDRVVQLVARSYYGGDHLRQVGEDSLKIAYDRFGMPSVADWVALTKALASQKNTYQWRDAVSGLVHRLQRLIAQFPGMTRTRHGIPHSVLAQRSIYLGASHHNDTYDFLGTHLVHLVHHAAVAAQDRDTLRRLLILDEGLLSFGATNRIDGPVLLPLIPLLREHGTGVVITTAHLGGIHETLRANAYTTIVLPLNNATDASLAARTLGLSAAQAEHLLRLKIGQAVVRTGKCETPFVITFPPPAKDKTVDPADWQRALARTDKLAPADTTSTPRTTIPTPATTTNRPAASPTVIPSNTLPPPMIAHNAPAPVIPSNTTPMIASNTTPRPPAVVAPNTGSLVAPALVLPVALGTAERALLPTVAELVISPSVIAYRAAGLTLQAGDRAAKNSKELGLLNREQIIAHQGRGGSAIALYLTRAGYDRLDKKPPHGLRAGSSAQHTYLVVTLAKLIPDARIEATLGGQGGKSIDLLLHLTAQHECITRVLTTTATCLVANQAPLNNGDLVAIEVETSADTVVNNIRKNLAAGVAHNITAVMPKALDATRKVILLDIPSDQLARVLVVNVFDLIEALQENKG